MQGEFLVGHEPSQSPAVTAPPKGELLCICRQVEQNLPLSGEVDLRSKDGEGSARLRQAEAFPQCRAFAESGAASAAPIHDPSRENGIAERPQTLRYSEIKNLFSADYGQSKAEAILNRSTPGGVHHKIRAFGNAILRKIPLLQRHPPGGKIRVTRALPRL